MICDIVIKSYPADYRWLSYCLKSIEKFASGFNDVIVLLPRTSPLNLTKEKVVYLDTPESYLTQQISKLNADLHTQADYILHVDSDVCFTKPVTPESFMAGDKVRWLMTPWGECLDAKKAWAHVMVKLLGEMPSHDFMRKSTILIPRWVYAKFREFIQETQGMSMESYVMNQPGHEFSEYNTLGFYLWLHHREKINFHDTTVLGVPDIGELQSWSWGGLTPEIESELTKITQ